VYAGEGKSRGRESDCFRPESMKRVALAQGRGLLDPDAVEARAAVNRPWAFLRPPPWEECGSYSDSDSDSRNPDSDLN
jgi:hypothetical protein